MKKHPPLPAGVPEPRAKADTPRDSAELHESDLEQATGGVKANPGAYINPDGTVNRAG